MKKIQIASLGKRLLSALIDIVLMSGITCLFYFCVFSKAVSSVHHYDVLNNQIKEEQIKSNLYTSDGKMITLSINNPGEKDLEKPIKDFYVSYMPTKDKEKYQGDYWYATHILFLDDVKGLYTKEGISKPEKILFEWDDKTQCTTYHHIKTGQGYEQSVYDKFYIATYGTAVTLLNNTNPIANNIKTMSIGNIRAVIYATLIGTAIPYLALPLIFKNGKTLGKYITHLIVLNDEGYENKKYKYIFRYLSFYFIEIFGGVVTVSLTLVLSSCLVLFSKKRKALHDYISFTVVVDEINSVWFKDEKEELEYKNKAELKKIEDNKK